MSAPERRKPAGGWRAGLKCAMDYSDFIVWKAVGLVVLVFVVNLVYAFKTGETIEETRAKRAQSDSPPDQPQS